MKEENFNAGKVLKVILICILLLIFLTAIGIIIYVNIIDEEEAKNLNETQPVLVEQSEQAFSTTSENKLSTLPTVEVDMPEKIGDYNILGEIEIPEIGVKKYILDTTTDESLNLSLTRFWGKGIHEAGNFSIIGHNYKGIFKDLKNLELEDTFTLTDREGRICTYVIYEIFIVEPDDVSCIDDTLIGEREVTLITCTTGGAKRLILKAKEQK